MAVRMTKPWQTLNEQTLEPIGGQTGVFELANESGETIYIGAADSRSLHGLKGALKERLATANQFRCEITTAYSTRRQELLMVHYADHGHYPEQNTPDETRNLGRLSP